MITVTLIIVLLIVLLVVWVAHIFYVPTKLDFNENTAKEFIQQFIQAIKKEETNENVKMLAILENWSDSLQNPQNKASTFSILNGETQVYEGKTSVLQEGKESDVTLSAEFNITTLHINIKYLEEEKYGQTRVLSEQNTIDTRFGEIDFIDEKIIVQQNRSISFKPSGNYQLFFDAFNIARIQTKSYISFGQIVANVCDILFSLFAILV